MEMSSGQVSRDPDYSLGLYEKTSVIRERGEYWNETARIVKVSGRCYVYSFLPLFSSSLSGGTQPSSSVMFLS